MMVLQGKPKLMWVVLGMRQVVQAVPFKTSVVDELMLQPLVASWAMVLPSIWIDACASLVRSTLIDFPPTSERSNVQALTPLIAALI